INSGYTGTITQASGASVTIASSDFTQHDGAFTGSNNGADTMSISGNFTITGGTFTATKGTTIFHGSFLHSVASGTFLHNGGTVNFAETVSGFQVDSTNGETFNNLNFNMGDGVGLFEFA